MSKILLKEIVNTKCLNLKDLSSLIKSKKEYTAEFDSNFAIPKDGKTSVGIVKTKGSNKGVIIFPMKQFLVYSKI